MLIMLICYCATLCAVLCLYVIFSFPGVHESTAWRGTCILFRRADTLGDKRLDFFFGWQMDVVFLHKQIRI